MSGFSKSLCKISSISLTKPPSGGFKLVRKTKNEDKKMKTLNVRF